VEFAALQKCLTDAQPSKLGLDETASTIPATLRLHQCLQRSANPSFPPSPFGNRISFGAVNLTESFKNFLSLRKKLTDQITSKAKLGNNKNLKPVKPVADKTAMFRIVAFIITAFFAISSLSLHAYPCLTPMLLQPPRKLPPFLSFFYKPSHELI
jgi:hypothetical protein